MGKIKYASVRVYIQADGESWRAVANLEREVEAVDSPGLLRSGTTAEFGEVKSDPLEAIADALERVGAGS